MQYHFGRVNHSIRGSFLVVENEENKIKIKTVRNGYNEVFCVVPDGEYEALFSESEVSIKTETAKIKICLVGTDDIYIKGKGSGFIIEHKEYTDRYIANFVVEEDNCVVLNNSANDSFERFSIHKGTIKVDAPRTKNIVKHDYINVFVDGDDNGEFEVLIEQFFSPSLYPKFNITYDDCVRKNENDYQLWEQKFDVENDIDREAVYVMWSNICAAGGNYKDEAMLMSKSGMSAVWSWDNCINALGLAKADPEFALKQFLFPYQYMDEYGSTPDCVFESKIVRNFVKPPVQGWVYTKLVEKNRFFEKAEVIEKIYPLMKKNTQWWLKFRGDVPYYYHGNDSGADNASCFDKCCCIETGELSAFLAIQCKVLANMAQKQGILEEQKVFNEFFAKLLKTSLDDFFDGRLFVREKKTKKVIYSNSLLPYRVIVLEDMITNEIKEHIISSLKKNYITKNGIASEAINSEFFEEDGYWRGAVWAPDQVIFLLAMNTIGETELAKEIAKNYIDSLSRAGFYENTSALSGRGLRCVGHTWTASAYMVLKNILND